jgi:hypothetical protein
MVGGWRHVREAGLNFDVPKFMAQETPFLVG